MSEDNEEDRIEVDFLGRNLGTASGWDGEPGEVIWFYDFEPSDGINLQKGELQIDIVKGIIGIQNDKGDIGLPMDVVPFLMGIPRNV